MGGYREEWDIYFKHFAGEWSSLLLNLGYGRVAPLGDRPWLICVHLAAKSRRENGLPTPSEMTILQDLEEAIFSVTDKLASVTYVGSVTSGSQRMVVFFGAEKDSITSATLGMVPRDRRRGKFVTVKNDPQWKFYLEKMLPSDLEYRVMVDKRVLMSLKEQGDDPTKPRRVDHWIWFKDASARDRFQDWARSNGFGIEKLIEPDNERKLIGVQIHRMSDVVPDTIHGSIASLVEAAESMGGDYDGWETHAVIAAPDTPGSQEAAG